MSLKNKVESAIDTAFNKVGDLADTVILQKVTTKDYNFTTGQTEEQTTSLSVSAIIIVSSDEPFGDGSPRLMKEVLVKRKETGDPEIYDSVTISGVNHKIVSHKDEFGLITLKVTEG